VTFHLLHRSNVRAPCGIVFEVLLPAVTGARATFAPARDAPHVLNCWHKDSQPHCNYALLLALLAANGCERGECDLRTRVNMWLVHARNVQLSAENETTGRFVGRSLWVRVKSCIVIAGMWKRHPRCGTHGDDWVSRGNKREGDRGERRAGAPPKL
jgi:hypothetical protein